MTSLPVFPETFPSQLICLPRSWLTVPSKYSIVCNLPALNPYNGLMLCNAVISSHDISTVSKYTQYTIACHSVAWGCAKAQLLRRVQGYGIKNEYLSIMLTLPNKKLLPPGIFTVTLQCPKIQGHDYQLLWSANTKTFKLIILIFKIKKHC